MTFDQYWETDEAFAYRHADERTQAEAAWNAALEEAACHFDEDDTQRYGWTADHATIARKLRSMKTPPR